VKDGTGFAYEDMKISLPEAIAGVLQVLTTHLFLI